MKVSIHQPNYLPYPGFFEKIKQSDCFVFFDDVQFTKGGYQNRTKLVDANKSDVWSWITIPLHNPTFKITKDVQISYDVNWTDTHIKKLNQLSKRNNEMLIAEIIKQIQNKPKFLVDLTMPLIKLLLSHFNINSKIFISSELVPSKNNMNATEKIISLCSKLNAGEYLSGSSGKDYLDKALFDKDDIQLKFIKLPQQYDFIKINSDADELKYSVINYV